jgi:hypothetical protein
LQENPVSLEQREGDQADNGGYGDEHQKIKHHPRIIFLHYYGGGPAATLAEGFRAALDQLGANEKYADS